MKFFIALILLFLVGAAIAQPKDPRYFELRIYYAANGKLDALIKRFTDHTTRIFEKHGMQNIGYWVPVTNDHNALYYILAYPTAEARDQSWKAFGSDPEWKKVAGESEKNGKLVDSVKSVFLYASDIMPAINGSSSGAERVFELRTYHCQPGKLPNLITRFKDHTLKLFDTHGLQNIFYFVTAEKDNKQPDLVYLLAHKSVDDAKKSWDAFRADPDWIKARDNSEKDGKLLVGLESVYLKPLAISKLK